MHSADSRAPFKCHEVAGKRRQGGESRELTFSCASRISPRGRSSEQQCTCSLRLVPPLN